MSSGAKLTFGTLRADFNLVVVVFDDEQVDDVVEFVGVSMLIAATPTDILLINDDIPVVGVVVVVDIKLTLNPEEAA